MSSHRLERDCGRMHRVSSRHTRSSHRMRNRPLCSAAFPIVPPDAAALASPPADAVQAVWVGHATVLCQMEGVSFITDPLFSQRCSPVQFMGPQR